MHTQGHSTSDSSQSRTPLVSAIIIFLNGEKYIREAIESVRRQTLEDWELILCDDGTTDGATAIAKEYADRYPGRIKYVEHAGHANHGMSATRMLGVRNSTGRYIAWLDADDVWLPNKLERQVAILEANPEAAICYGPLTYWYSWSGKEEDRDRDVKQNLGVELDQVHQPPTVLLKFLQDIEHHPSGVMVRREVLNAIGGYESSFRGEYEDVVTQSKVCLQYPIYAASESWYLYRQHPASCCAAMNREGKARAKRLIYLQWLQQYVAGKGITGPVVDAVEREMKPYANRVGYTLSEMASDYKRLATSTVKRVVRAVTPWPLRAWLRAKSRGQRYTPPVGWVRFGNLRRQEPIDRGWGWHRGLPTDRYYIESFLAANADDVQGRVMEVADPAYTHRFGGAKVTKAEVLHVVAGNPQATIVGDLETGLNIPTNAFDCIILTQVLPFLFDVQAAVRHCHQALKPGGVLLLTVPGISQVSPEDRDSWGDYWRFTRSSVKRLLDGAFEPGQVNCQTYGNVLAATSFLYGIASNELTREELDNHDDQFEVIIAARAVKSPVPAVRHRGTADRVAQGQEAS